MGRRNKTILKVVGVAPVLLTDLIKFYQEIRNMSDPPFSVERVAQLELEWWVIHRQRADHHPEDLVKALAQLQSEIYSVPSDRLMDHGRLRTEAMTIRDTKAEQRGVTESRRKTGHELKDCFIARGNRCIRPSDSNYRNCPPLNFVFML